MLLRPQMFCYLLHAHYLSSNQSISCGDLKLLADEILIRPVHINTKHRLFRQGTNACNEVQRSTGNDIPFFPCYSSSFCCTHLSIEEHIIHAVDSNVCQKRYPESIQHESVPI